MYYLPLFSVLHVIIWNKKHCSSILNVLFLYTVVLIQASKHKNTVVTGHVNGHKLYMFTYNYYQQGLNNRKLR